jgi:NAD(P)-dependent dehydrogenase (short-subunit alcohol dehydrogenase family)
MMLVTGGTHGIGRACVERLARDGQRVLFVGVTATRARRCSAPFRPQPTSPAMLRWKRIAGAPSTPH